MSTDTITRGFRYVLSGTLTGTVNDVLAAKAYLVEDEMVQFLDGLPTVIDIRWELQDDGHHYEVVALSYSELNETEISDLTEWVRGQNSDGLGEGFEQQDFANDPEYDEPEMDWDEEMEQAPDQHDQLGMCSFDWKTNTSQFILVPRF